MVRSKAVEGRSFAVEGRSIAPPVTAEMFVSDDFENYTVGNWIIDETASWSGDGGFTITDARALNGSQSLEITGSIGYRAIVSNEGDGLGNYPSTGTTIRWGATMEAGYQGMLWAVPDGESSPHNNSYRIRFGPDNDMGSSGATAVIAKSVSGTVTVLDETTTTFPTSTWMDFACDYYLNGSGEVQFDATIYEYDSNNGEWVQWATLSGTDPDAAHSNSAGLGIEANNLASGETSTVDYYRYWNETGMTGTLDSGPSV